MGKLSKPHHVKITLGGGFFGCPPTGVAVPAERRLGGHAAMVNSYLLTFSQNRVLDTYVIACAFTTVNPTLQTHARLPVGIKARGRGTLSGRCPHAGPWTCGRCCKAP
jgi:hypothetical protein